jgi:hypothetical protein
VPEFRDQWGGRVTLQIHGNAVVEATMGRGRGLSTRRHVPGPGETPEGLLMRLEEALLAGPGRYRRLGSRNAQD